MEVASTANSLHITLHVYYLNKHLHVIYVTKFYPLSISSKRNVVCYMLLILENTLCEHTLVCVKIAKNKISQVGESNCVLYDSHCIFLKNFHLSHLKLQEWYVPQMHILRKYDTTGLIKSIAFAEDKYEQTNHT